MWFMSVPKFKFQSLKPGDIVRIRCVEVNLTTTRNVIQIKPYTNILRLPSQSSLASQLSKAIEDETGDEKLKYEDEANPILMEVVTLSEITDHQLEKSPLFKLTDLFLMYD